MRDGSGAGLEHGVEALRRRRWAALLVLAIGSTATAGLVSGLPNVYSGTATILVEPPQGIDPATPDEVRARLQLMTEVIESSDQLKGLIDRFGLYPRLRGALAEAAILERMRRDIRLEMKGPEDGSGRSVVAFTLSYRAPEPENAARVANALAERYVDEDSRLRGSAVEGLASQVAGIKSRLEEQEAQVSDFQERFKGQLPQELEANTASLKGLEAQLRVVSDARVRATDRRSALLTQRADPSATSASPSTREGELVRLRRQLAELRRTYTDKYPDVISLKSEIAALEQQPLAGPQGSDQDSAGSPALQAALRDAEADVKSLTEEEQRLRLESQQYRGRVEGAPRLQQELQQKVRDYETTRGLYNALLKRLQESQLQSQTGAASGQRLRLLEPAQAPKQPVGPKRFQLLMLGLLLTISSSGFVVAAAEKIDSSFHSVQEVRQFTRVPVLATIPVVLGRTRAARRIALRASVFAVGALCVLLVGQVARRVAQANPEIASLVSRAR